MILAGITYTAKEGTIFFRHFNGKNRQELVSYIVVYFHVISEFADFLFPVYSSGNHNRKGKGITTVSGLCGIFTSLK
jgi:hypothetical protein